jgi:hypothetical protein
MVQIRNRWMLIKKPVEGGRGEGARRASSDLPGLHGPHADRQSSSIKNLDDLRLAQMVFLAPNLKSPNNRGDRLLGTGG